MNRRELRRTLRERRASFRRSFAEARQRARTAAAQHPAVKRARRAKRLRRALLVAIGLLLLSLIHCECGPALAPTLSAVDAGTPVPPVLVKKAPKPVKPGPLFGTMPRQPRPGFVGEGVATPPWLDEFRLQVSARSPRLAKCFVGAPRPGALRWVCSVNASSGAVADHELEPVGAGDELTPEQRTCLLAALSTPVYRLTQLTPSDLPNRVSLVIEF